MLKLRLTQLFVFIFAGFVSISCDDSSTGPSEEHVDAEGMILESNETEMYREFQGGIVTNNLTLPVGSTIDLSVHFLDHDEAEIEHENEEHESEEEELSFQISDSSVISAVAEEHEEGDGDDDGDEEHHELGFELTGLSVGTTTFTISLMHDGHADYTSLEITVTVTE